MSETETAASSRQHQAENERGQWRDEGPGQVVGNLTADPSLNFTGSGRPVCSIRIATTTRMQDASSGEWVDGPAEFHNVAIWGGQGQRVAECLMKGDRIVAVGRWQSREYVNGEGERRTQRQLVARDLGASLLFRPVRIMRRAGKRGDQ